MIIISLLPFFALIGCAEKTSDPEDTSTTVDTAMEDTGAEEIPVPAEIVLSDRNLTLTYIGETALLTASVLDQFGAPIDSNLSWDVSDTTIISVDEDGAITAQDNGMATLTARVEALEAIVQITVSQIEHGLTVTPNELLFSTIGESQDVLVQVKDAGGFIMDSPVTWESTNPSVVTIDSAGIATAQGNGIAEITARVATLTSSVAVEVEAITFSLDSNGITVLCPDAAIGDTGEIDGVVYTKRDRAGLDNLIQARDWTAISTTCTSGMQDMSLLFYNVYEPFEDITTWDVSSVTNTYRMFYNAGFFDQDIGHWNVSTINNMNGMFDGAFMFNQDISSWNVSNVTNMQGIFSSAASFNQDISGWDVSSVTNMLSMFFDASNFNQDISGWDVSNVTDMDGMFCDAINFNQDLSGWCVLNITSEPHIFTCDDSAWTHSKPIWGTCPN